MGMRTEGPSSTSTALADNRRLVLEALRASPESTRTEISLATGLSSAATARITAQLESERLIARTVLAPSGGGRPAWRYRFSAEGRHVAALRIQAQRCTGVLLDWHEREHGRVVIKVEGIDRTDYLDAMLECVGQLLAAGRELGGTPVALGVAVPSVVDLGGVVGAGYEVPLDGIALGELLTAETGVPVIVENDANALAFSELDGVTPAGSLAALLLGFGVGAGIVSEGHLLRGAHRAAGEIGYLLTGRTALVGGPDTAGYLERRIQDAAGSPDASAPVRLWEFLGSDDPDTADRAATMIDYLALAVASLTTVVDPERIVIGDVPVEAGTRLVSELTTRLRGRLLHPPVLTLARRGPDAVIVGAGLLAMGTVDLQAL